MQQIVIFTLMTLLLSACTNMAVEQEYKGQFGAAVGAATGAIVGQAIGHNTEATLIGTAVGTLLGYMVGNEMDKFDQQQLNRVYERGVSNQTATWINPDSGYQYQVMPKQAYHNQNNFVCREAEIVATIDGRLERVHATACRDQYGRWQMKR